MARTTTISGFETVDSLATDLRKLGLSEGMTVLVHTSLSSLGWVAGGEQAVIQALEQVITPQGTLVMPTMTPQLSEPATWTDPSVPTRWWPQIREQLPVYRPDLTPSRGVGAVPEAFRKQDGVVRSEHPHTSFSAWGRRASHVVSPHPLHDRLGKASPLGRLYALDGVTLLLGVGYASATMLHLAEAMADLPRQRTVSCSAPVLADGERRWITYSDIATSNADFDALGADFETGGGVVEQGRVGQADARLIPVRPLVDFAVTWMENSRT